MEIEEDGKHEDKIGDFHGETLKEDRLGTRVIEIVNLLRQRTREKSREAWLRRRMLRFGRGDTRTKRRRADSPMRHVLRLKPSAWITSKYHCETGRLCVMASQFRCTSKSVLW